MVDLTIGIPTFNREDRLIDLINFLLCEINKNDINNIEIIVSDNDPHNYKNKENLKDSINKGFISYYQNNQNIGAVKNVISIFEKAKGRYLWIIGDDDMPSRLLLKNIIHLVTSVKPSIIYIPSTWSSASKDRLNIIPTFRNSFKKINSLSLIKEAHIYVTFLSSWIVDTDQLRKDKDFNHLKYCDTNFPHLAWIGLLIKQNKEIFIGKGIGIHAIGGNSGGYDVIKSFSKELPAILNDSFGEHAAETRFLNKSIFGFYLPAIIGNIRKGNLGDFEINHNELAYYKGSLVTRLYFNFIIKRLIVCGKLELILLTFMYRSFKYIYLRVL